MDPDIVRKEIEESKQKIKEITTNFDELKKSFATKWRDFIAEYQNFCLKDDTLRAVQMNKVNPSFVLRNYLLEEAIQMAEGGDFTMVDSLLKHAETPYEEKEQKLVQAAPEWAMKICVSCSS